MRYYIAILSVLIILVSCEEHHAKVEDSISQYDIEVFLYPGGGSSHAYNIKFQNDSLYFGLVNGWSARGDYEVKGEIASGTKKLTKEELDSVNYFYEKLIQITPYHKEEMALGDWIYTFYNNGQKVVSFNSNDLFDDDLEGRGKELKLLVKYALDISPIKMKLRFRLP